ncbi:class I SAM-dependent methyltransferase [Chloroflexota bacterium]
MDNGSSEEWAGRDWDHTYRDNTLEELPWEEGAPSTELVELVESGLVEKGATLDICSGSGNNTVYLAKQGYQCYGIDISPTAVGYARQRANREGVSCELTSGDATELPYPDNTFSFVFDRGCFHSMPLAKRRDFIRGVHRVLKPGGKCQLICFSAMDHRSGPPYSFSPENIRRHFRLSFKIHWIKELTRETDGAKHYFLSVLMEKN